jgi:hypothetical protein
VLHSIVEEHKVHGSVQFVVLTEGITESSAEGINVCELIVKFLIKTVDEVSENQWFGCWLLEVLVQVELTERFLGKISSERTISLQVLSTHKTITIHTLRLVEPKFDKVIWFLDGFGSCLEETLENVGQVTNIEFVMEVSSSLSEISLD